MPEKNENKAMSEMSEKEILRKQLELLAEKSKDCEISELCEISKAMCDISEQIKRFESCFSKSK